MKRFTYKAKEIGTGKVIKGTIQAETERVAGKLLVDRGYVPELLKEEGSGLAEKMNKVTSKDRINFTRQFATLVGAGLPIAQSLRSVAEQTQNKSMKAVIEEILADVEAGRALSTAFSKHPDVFDKVYLSLIKAGETSAVTIHLTPKSFELWDAVTSTMRTRSGSYEVFCGTSSDDPDMKKLSVTIKN